MESKKSHNMQLVHAYWGETENDQLNKELDSILDSCATRADRLVKIAELCLPAETNEELYFVSKSYVWAGAAYRKEAIDYLKQYINVGAFWDGLQDGKVPMDGYVFDQKAGNIASVYTDLGTCYEGEYEFEEALKCYEAAYRLIPYSPSNIIKESNIYIKLNKLDIALSVLQDATKSEYYKLDSFSSSIDKSILDVKKKIEKGYVYKPRKKK